MTDISVNQIPCRDCDQRVTIKPPYDGRLAIANCPNGHQVVYFGPSGRKVPVCPRGCGKTVAVHVSKEDVVIRTSTTRKSVRPYPVTSITCDKHGRIGVEEFFPGNG